MLLIIVLVIEYLSIFAFLLIYYDSESDCGLEIGDVFLCGFWPIVIPIAVSVYAVEFLAKLARRLLA